MKPQTTFRQRPPWYRVVIIGALFLTVVMVSTTTFQVSDLISWRTWEKTETFADVTELNTIDVQLNGDITLVVNPKATDISVRKQVRAGRNEPHFMAVMNGTELSVNGDCDRFIFTSSTVCSVSAEITIPAKLNLRLVAVKSEIGSITVKDISATQLNARANLGDISLVNIVGDVEASSNNGSVSARTIDGNLQSRSNLSSVTAQNVTGTASAISSNGPVTVWDVAGPTTAISTLGDVLVCDARANIEATSDNGNVLVHAPEAGDPVNLEFKTARGTPTISGATSSQATTSVKVRSQLGAVSYLPYAGATCGNLTAK